MSAVILDNAPFSALTTLQADLCITSVCFCLFLHHASVPFFFLFSFLKGYSESSPAQTMELKSDSGSAETMRHCSSVFIIKADLSLSERNTAGDG